ncbi:MAG TPA: hypothetical protein VFH53_02110 [Phycisphaerae bacterium]|nr:hypothetical protein [Phycisphaerae bacterium]
MEEILGIILFLLLIGGASALRWWIEKQQRKKEAEEHQLHSTPAQPPGPPPGRRPAFYDRAGEAPRFAVPEAEPTSLQAPVLLLTDLEALEAPPLQTASHRRVARRPARREAEPQPSPAPQAEPLKSPGTIKAAAPIAVSRAGPFLGSLLERENLAKAIVLSEILGPPKALRES